MAFDFPTAPVSGTIYAPSGGPTYRWDGTVWSQLGVPFQGAMPSDTPPPNPVSGQLWWETDTGALFCYYNDGNSSQWVQVQGGGGLQSTAEARNRIVNGAMQISQENGNTASSAANNLTYHAADQWGIFNATGTGTVTAQRVQAVTPNGSKDRIRATVGTAKASLAATEYFTFRQMVEGMRIADFRYGTASAKQSVLRFGFKAPAGTYSFRLLNGDTNRSYVQNFTIAAGQANADTEQVFVIPGSTSGLFGDANNIGFYLDVVLACGTTYQGAAGWSNAALQGTSANTNGMATAGAVYELFDVGLYLDRNNTGVPPPWQMPDEAQELAACKRYWLSFTSFLVRTNATSSNIVFPVQLRTVPAFSGGGAGFTIQVGNISYASVHQTTQGYPNLTVNARM